MSEAERRDAVLVSLDKLSMLAGEAGMKTLKADLDETRIPKLREGRFNLVVLGEFNHGKSTFVNALLGAAVLPTGITPTTATINHIVWGEKPAARAVMEDGSERKITVKALEEWVTVEGDNIAGVKFVEVAYPSELLREQVTLVDTPGVNDLNEQRAEITYGYVPRADAVVFLLDAGQILKQSEREFLQQRVLERSRDKLVFVIAKIDQLTDEEAVTATAYARENLAKIVPEPALFAVSARNELGGKREQSGFAALLAHLKLYLSEERGRLIIDNAIGDGLRTATFLRQNLEVKRQALSLDIEELESRVARVRAHLAPTRKSLEDLHFKIGEEAGALKARARDDLAEFTRELAASLPGQIDAVDAQDVRKYLQPYIEETFKRWAEQQGDTLGKRLEALAEEIIQITNQSVRDATEILRGELGGAETRLTIEVDTLKYDLSVFALGAFGTTIFLFVNTLVGGLLFVAAPVLAMVMKGRVASEIKEQARERAPEVVQKAAEAVGPRLIGIVDDFTGKLRDFVDGAGGTLYRSLSEVLDQALTERRTRGANAPAVIAEVTAALARLGEVEAELAGERAALWSPPAAT